MSEEKISEKWAEEVVARKSWSALGKKFAFYGSLRTGQYNYKRLVEAAAGMKFEGERVLTGYKMFSFGSFPFVVPSDNPEDTIVIELFDIPDEMAARYIHNMEVGAGYGVEEVLIDGEVYWLYIYTGMRDYEKSGYTRVSDGDWVKYLSEKGKTSRLSGGEW